MDDDRVLGGGGFQFAGAGPHQGVDDRVQYGELLGVGEDDGAEPGPVQASVGGEHVGAEGLDDRGEARSSRRDDLTRDAVGVDQHGTALHEQP
ncbi:hypothetical protein SALBM311S_00253 [Streptomyces alboniger]